ncbi:MAG TPA: DUF935 family protein [Candidatus Gastranaerophilales bacterium]|nr:DUF935 family protein [Candidatus Gastranaerophilales bacterium]
MKKLWLNEREYVCFSESKKTLASEIATRGRSIDFYSILKYLPDPDPILRKQGRDIKIYRDYLSDPHVWACVQSRKSGVLSLEWEIDRGKSKSKQADIIENLFNNLDLNTIISEILDCVLFGFQPLEVMWKQEGSLILPSDIIAKPPEWFVFDDENRLKLKTKDNPYGEELPEKKFLCPQYNPSYLNPYGERTLSRIFWNITFKKGGVKFWSLFTEKYGMPFLVGKHPRRTTEKDSENLKIMLQKMVHDAIVVIPDDSSVELKESVKTSSSDVYERLVDKMNAEISKAILGQTLTTEIGSTGSYAASNTHMGVRQDIIEADKKIVERTLNRLIRWIYQFNFTGQNNIPIFSLFEEEDADLNLIADRDKKISEIPGVRFTKKYLMKTYGFDEDDIEVLEVNAPEKPQPAFKEFTESQFPDQQTIDKFIDSFSDNELQAQADTVLKPVIKMIQEANSYEEIYEKLSEKGLRTNEIEKILQKVIFTSETWGRINGLD